MRSKNFGYWEEDTFVRVIIIADFAPDIRRRTVIFVSTWVHTMVTGENKGKPPVRRCGGMKGTEAGGAEAPRGEGSLERGARDRTLASWIPVRWMGGIRVVRVEIET